MFKKMIRVLLLLTVLAGCDSDEPETWLQVEVVDCDVALTSCHAVIDGLEVSLTLEPGLVPLKHFSVNAQIAGTPGVEQVAIDFQMVGMEMGLNRYRLLSGQNGWQGTATLPICGVSRTDWFAILEFRRGEKNYRLRFPFTTQ